MPEYRFYQNDCPKGSHQNTARCKLCGYTVLQNRGLTIAQLVDYVKSWVGAWDTPVEFRLGGASLRLARGSFDLRSIFRPTGDTPEPLKLEFEAGTPGVISDGHHTFEELYYYRMLYNAQAVLAWLAAGIKVEKSWNHHDGEPCFGGGMFVVQAELPTGQVSNHYKAEYWDLFNVPAVELPTVYDGHTPAIAAERMRDYLVSLQTG